MGFSSFFVSIFIFFNSLLIAHICPQLKYLREVDWYLILFYIFSCWFFVLIADTLQCSCLVCWRCERIRTYSAIKRTDSIRFDSISSGRIYWPFLLFCSRSENSVDICNTWSRLIATIKSIKYLYCDCNYMPQLEICSPEALKSINFALYFCCFFFV